MTALRALLFAAVALCLVASAYSAECTLDETAAMTTCYSNLGVQPGGGTTPSAELCTWMKKAFACYPKCECEKAYLVSALKEYKDAPHNCKDLKCGSAAGLRASAFSVFVTAAVALVTAQRSP